MSNYTYGAELELADWNRLIKIPNNLGVMDVNDISVCNSNGVGVNPYLDSGYGGEICTVPSTSSDDLLFKIVSILNIIKPYNINHSCWLHIHIGFNKQFSLSELKDMLVKVHKANKWIPLTHLAPVKELEVNSSLDISDDIVDIVSRRNLTRTSRMSELEYSNALNSKSIDEFWSFFSRKRHLINMQSLKIRNTLEFRFFYMSDDYNAILNAVEFCESVCNHILLDSSIELRDKYPLPIKININREKTYLETKVEKRVKVDNFTKMELY